MQEHQLDRKAAAAELADQIRRLAEERSIDTLYMKIYDWDSDNLFRLAKKVGVKELTIIAISGVSRQNNSVIGNE